MKKYSLFALIFIILLGLFLRVYKLTKVPPSLNWDETAAAYNAYAIKNWAKDEWGNKLPLVFTSFRDDKHPVHIYATALTYAFFGVSDFTTRLPSVIVGVFSILFIYLFVKYLTGSEIGAIFSSLFLAVSPYAIHYSRGLWEANFAIGLFIFGLGSFFYGIFKNKYFIILSGIFFGLSILSYHSAKVVVPAAVLLLTLLYIKDLIKIKKQFIAGILLFLGLFSLIFFEPRLLGLARVSQTKLPPELVENTYLYKNTNSELLGRLEVSLRYYKKYFTYDYLFKTGDQEPRGSVKMIGEFYKLHLLLFPLGIAAFMYRKKWKHLIFLSAWILLAPVPGALAGASPNSTRSIFMLGTFEVLSGIGAAAAISLVKKNYLKIMLSLLTILILGFEGINYYKYYLEDYSEKEAIQWQYGMRQVVEAVNNNPEYEKVYITKVRNQPYIFFLYYLRYPLPKLLETVKYDETGSKSYNTIESFGKYSFGNWDYIESKPIEGVLYVVTKSEFTGFRYGDSFNIKDVVRFPGGDEAFYIVSVF